LENLKRRNHVGKCDVGGRIILKYIWKIQDVNVWMVFSPADSSCKHDKNIIIP
jgi:hypothetical protein